MIDFLFKGNSLLSHSSELFCVLKCAKHEWAKVFTNRFCIIFDTRKWGGTKPLLLVSVLRYLTSTSSTFLQQPISYFNSHGIFCKPLENTWDMSGRIDSVVLCKRAREFTSQLWETKIVPSPHLCFLKQGGPSFFTRWLRRSPLLQHPTAYTLYKKSLRQDSLLKIWVISSGSHR